MTEELKKRLEEIMRATSVDDQIDQIEQAFTETGWLSPDKVKQIQESVNGILNLAHDVARLPATVHVLPAGYMTGQEWYDKYFEAFDSLSPFIGQGGMTERGRAIEAAKKASGIES